MSDIARVLRSAIVLWTGLAGNILAQSVHGGLTYQPAWLLSSTDGFVSAFSWQGVGLDVRRFISDYVAVGLTSGWNEFTAAATDDTVPAQHRSINAFPVLLALNGYAGQPGRFRLFLGGNAGVYLIQQRLDGGPASISEMNVHAGLGSEAGFTVPLSANIISVFQLRYNYAFPAGHLGSQSYITYGIGLTWAWHP